MGVWLAMFQSMLQSVVIGSNLVQCPPSGPWSGALPVTCVVRGPTVLTCHLPASPSVLSSCNCTTQVCLVRSGEAELHQCC